MPNFDNKIENRTVGDAFDVTRTVGGINAAIAEAFLTVMPNGASDTSLTNLFQKHITATPSAIEGVIDSATSYNITAAGEQVAGATSLTVAPLPTTVPKDVVLQFAGGAWTTVKEKALQGAASIMVNQIDAPIANGEIAVYKTVRLKFKIKSTNSALLVPNQLHAYDIEVITVDADPYTVEDGTFKLRPQRTA